jgi:simple sugar transport system substrate-binding protein
MKKIVLAVTAGLVLLAAFSSVVMAAGADLNQKMTMAHLPKSVGGAWFTRMFEGFKKYAENTGSEVFQIGPSVGDAAAQNRNVQDVIAQGVDAIGVIPFSPEQIDSDLKKAKDAGIIVITSEGTYLNDSIDYDVEPFDSKLFGASVAELYNKGMGGKGEIIFFVGSLASTAHVSWTDGIVNGLKDKYPGIKAANAGGIYIETGNNAANAYEKAKEALKAYPNATGIWCPSSTDTPSIARAIEEAGLVDKITYAAVGLPNATRTYIKSGSIDFLTSWDPAELGLAMCKAAAAVKSGTPIKNGDDLGVFGYSKLILDGKVISGNEWRVVTAEDADKYDY